MLEGRASLALIVLLAASVQVSIAIIGQMQDDTWKEYHYQLYETKWISGNWLNPLETRDLLRKLLQIYAPYLDDQTNGRKSRVEALEQASHIGLEHCERHRLLSYYKLVHKHSIYIVNILPYLDYYYHKFYETCIDNHYEILHRRVRLVGKQRHEDMALLAEYVAETPIKGRSPLGWAALVRRAPLENLNAGILRFLKHKLGDSFDLRSYRDSELGETKYFQHLNENVFELCRVWTKAVDFTVALFEMGAEMQLTQEEEMWTLYGFLCGKIFLMGDEIRRDTYRAVRRMRQVDGHGKQISKFVSVAVRKSTTDAHPGRFGSHLLRKLLSQRLG